MQGSQYDFWRTKSIRLSCISTSIKIWTWRCGVHIRRLRQTQCWTGSVDGMTVQDSVASWAFTINREDGPAMQRTCIQFWQLVLDKPYNPGFTRRQHAALYSKWLLFYNNAWLAFIAAFQKGSAEHEQFGIDEISVSTEMLFYNITS
jgi:hypothetical protein